VVRDTRKICPSGWHVPSAPEWCTLINYLGGQDVAGGKLKEDGLTHWSSPNIGATNESGFTALPGGYREGNTNGLFVDQGFLANFWSTTEYDESLVFYQNLSTFNQWAYCQSDLNYKKGGASIRCVKD
jgi:uncharacterized protein (TIGR02145 family)